MLKAMREVEKGGVGGPLRLWGPQETSVRSKTLNRARNDESSQSREETGLRGAGG